MHKKKKLIPKLFIESTLLKNWWNMPSIPNAYSDSAPTVTSVGKRICVAFKGNSDDRIHIAETEEPADNSSWSISTLPDFPGSGQEPRIVRTSHGPTLSEFNNLLWLAFKGHNNPLIWLLLSGPRGWRPRGYLEDAQTAVGPSISGNMIAHRGNHDNQIWYKYASPGIPSHGENNIPNTHTDDTPAVAYTYVNRHPVNHVESRRKLPIVAYRDSRDNAIMFTRMLPHPITGYMWTGPDRVPGAWSREGPALAMHVDLLFLAFRSQSDNKIWIGSYDGHFNHWVLHGTVPYAYTSAAPALVSVENSANLGGRKLYVFFKGHNNDSIWYGEVPVHAYHLEYNAIPHHFKMGDLDMTPGNFQCRRRETCRDPPPQTIYPQCIPTAWARLLSAYRIVLPPEQRRWEIGDPSNPNPRPDQDGDYSSSHSMGVIGIRDPSNPENWLHRPSRVDDWPNLRQIPFVTRSFDIELSAVGGPGPHWDLTPSDQDKIKRRADEIERVIKDIVPRGQPVYIEHGGHAWNIFACNVLGYYSHGQNPESEGLNDFCSWGNAPWRMGDERKQKHYAIKYPILGSRDMKPEYRRLGSLSFWLWVGEWASPMIQFVDLLSGRTIDWTPNMRASPAGYIWIEEAINTPDLQRNNGVPINRPADEWDTDLGSRIPVPENDREHCICHDQQGCARCRTRLKLTFWVSNITLDSHRYRVDLFIWTPNSDWRSAQAQRIEKVIHNGQNIYPCFDHRYENWYGDRLPCPFPGQSFEIGVRPDPGPGPAGKNPDKYDWQPFGWYIDFTRSQLDYNQTYGVRLILTCLDNGRIQDIKQLWFKTKIM
jgi:hypothetical protein